MLQDRLERRLFLLGAGISLWLVLAMPVFAQESYYWTYSQHPDLSYFDHPPMVAWWIWLGTAVFGDGAVGIRMLTWLSGVAVSLLGLRLLAEFGIGTAARRLWLLATFCVPSLLATRFLANPDPPLACFWLACTLALWRARGGGLGWWALAGLLAGCALLSKYTAIFLAAGGLLVLLFDPPMRRQWLRPGPWLGVAVAAVTFLPVVWWNVANDFESFRFQTSGRASSAHFGFKWFGQLVFGQFFVLNPAVAVLLSPSLWWLWRRGRGGDERARWLLAFGAPMLLFLIGCSWFVQVKINWLVPSAVVLLPGIVWWWADSGFGERHPVATRRLRYVFLAPLVIPLLGPLIVLWPQTAGTTWTGWEEIAARAEHWETEIDRQDGVEGNMFFFAPNYRDAAQLARHLKICAAGVESGAAVEPTLAQNVVGEQALQFDHWEPPAHRIGQDAIFVLPRPELRERYVDKIREHFAVVDRKETVAVHRLGIEVMTADIYVCRDYHGPGR